MDCWRDHRLWLGDFGLGILPDLGSPIEVARAEILGFRGRHPEIGFVRVELDLKMGDAFCVSVFDEGIVVSGGEPGVLYGAYSVLFDLALGREVRSGFFEPGLKWRMIDSWDNMDGSVERGYSGRSIWFDQGRFCYEPDRIRQLGRFLASVGINVFCINNVNVDHEASFLPDAFLDDAAVFAGILRPFGVRLMFSVDFSLPIRRGVGTADPLADEVCLFWKEIANRIWEKIPNFAGFLVKADAEHRPGPFTYGRSHTDGANMLARAVRDHGGILVWRAFVYNCKQDWRDTSTDRPCAAYDTYAGLDGDFDDNVFLQVKNGPYDFQVCEPLSPLFFAMKNTHLSLEVQIAQEYTGQQIDLFAMPSYWSGIFRGIPEGNIEAAAGVSNLGNDAKWTGHPFAALNLFAFGRLSWYPNQDPEELVREWIRLSYSLSSDEENTLFEILKMSRTAYAKYTSTLGLGWMVQPATHYGPSPYGYEFDLWGTYNRADRDAVGIDRTENGTGYLLQYPEEMQDIYRDPLRCPDELLLFFHRLPYDFVMRDGRMLIQRIYDDHFEGYEMVVRMQEMLKGISGLPALDRACAMERMERQRLNAREWRDVVNTFFHRLSGVPDKHGRKIYE